MAASNNSKVLKRISKTKTLKSLPSHLLKAEVFARLALSDLVNVKLSCKDYNAMADDPFVLEHVTIDSPLTCWNTNASSLWSRCKDCDNPEALYRQGMVDFFGHTKMESGLCGLRRAAAKGHVEACYVLGMILLCLGSNEGGLRLVSEAESLRCFESFKDCRDKAKGFLASMWVSDRVIDTMGRREIRHCFGCGSVVRKGCGRGWRNIGDDDEDDGVVDDKGCGSCKYYRQLVLFSNMLSNSTR